MNAGRASYAQKPSGGGHATCGDGLAAGGGGDAACGVGQAASVSGSPGGG